jgi:hypothetical protein
MNVNRHVAAQQKPRTEVDIGGPSGTVTESLLYVQIGTRPDISFAVSHLVQYASNPSLDHIRLAKYVLCYLKGTSDLKLLYNGGCRNGLYGYSDSSWGDNLDDRHSTAAYVFLLANAAIS